MLPRFHGSTRATVAERDALVGGGGDGKGPGGIDLRRQPASTGAIPNTPKLTSQ